MDPNISLSEARDLALALRAASEGFQPLDSENVDKFVDAFLNLDEWITNGGYLPSEWVSKN